MAAAHSGKGGRIVIQSFLASIGLGPKQAPWHRCRSCRHRYAVDKITAGDLMMHPQTPIFRLSHDLPGADYDSPSAFFTANSAAWKPRRLWAPSQNGLLTDPPQRHKEKAGLPVRSNLLPLISTNSTVPSAASTRYGPLGLTVIFTWAMKSFLQPY